MRPKQTKKKLTNKFMYQITLILQYNKNDLNKITWAPSTYGLPTTVAFLEPTNITYSEILRH
jgi:hypothetical protein